jgi:hypothetical protein
MYRKCGIIDISQSYRHPKPVAGIALHNFYLINKELPFLPPLLFSHFENTGTEEGE